MAKDAANHACGDRTPSPTGGQEAGESTRLLRERPHADVLESIRSLEIDGDLHRSWFRPAIALDAYGREQPSIRGAHANGWLGLEGHPPRDL